MNGLTPDEITLVRLVRIVENVLDSIEQMNLEEGFKKQLRDALSNASTNDQLDMSEVRRKYADIADRYLQLKQPFHWNSTKPGDPQNPKKDLEQYLELIEHCSFTRNTDLLDRWGIAPLQEQGGKVLAEEINYYETALEFLKEKKSSNTTEPFFEYLIKSLKFL